MKRILSVFLVVFMLLTSAPLTGLDGLFMQKADAVNMLYCPTGSIGMATNRPFNSSTHNGVDIAQGKAGVPIYAAMSGTVYYDPECPYGYKTGHHDLNGNCYTSIKCGGFGRGIIIEGFDGYYYHYGHLAENYVKKGDTVNKGDKIGIVGETGSANGPHLHFCISKTMDGKSYYNPLDSSLFSYSFDNQPPTKPTVSASMNKYIPGETATFTWNAPGATSVHLYVNDASGKRYFEGQFTGKTATKVMNEGWYAYGIIAHYPSGDVESQWHELNVYKPTVSASMNKYIPGETATFTWNAPGATSVHLYVNDASGKRYFEGQFTGKTATKVMNEGWYAYGIIAHYPGGDVESQWHEIIINNHSHSYTSSVTKLPTCTTTGVKTFKCSTCDNSYTESVAALGHDYTTTFTIDTSATCTTAGSKSKHCSRCFEKTDVTVIPATGHTYENACDADCNTCGYTRTTTHTWNSGAVTKAETCTAKGIKTYTCSICKAIKTEDIAALGHDYATRFTIDTQATCTSAGSKSKHCSRCDAKTEVTVIKATGHIDTYGTKGAGATCTEDGITPGTVCKDCGTVISGQEVIKATGHKEVVYSEMIPPTCTADGHTAETRCINCGIVMTKSKVIPATAHTDNKKDGICDECGTEMTIDNPSANCSCNCHKSGFMGFIYKIQRFFWRLFGTNKVCKCGVTHY